MLQGNQEGCGVLVGHISLGSTPPPCVFKVKVVSGCNKRTEKRCFHVFYFIYLCWFYPVVAHHFGPEKKENYYINNY